MFDEAGVATAVELFETVGVELRGEIATFDELLLALEFHIDTLSMANSWLRSQVPKQLHKPRPVEELERRCASCGLPEREHVGEFRVQHSFVTLT